MLALVLESFVGSNYADSPTSYEFPSRYLRAFDPLGQGESMVAVIYEPRGVQHRGRMAYVGWAMLQSPPVLSERKGQRGTDLYAIRYADRYREFDRIVPREAIGEPVETWLRALPRGIARNSATRGRAVRGLAEEDLRLIMSLGFPNGADRASLEAQGSHAIAEAVTTEERSRRLVSAIQREARFRDEVLEAYQHRCSLSGLSVGASPSRAYGLLDAAHIRPVGNQGADTLSNGLALTPTLHRLFDKGLFTLEYRGTALEVRTSPILDQTMIEGREGFSLLLRDGLVAWLPGSQRARPSREALDYHRSQIFAAR